jgi:hypothetical protein
MNEAISSLWDGLSPHLIASFYEVNRDGKRLDENMTVQAPLLDANIEVGFNWQSPFERVGEDVLPTLQQLLQSGAVDTRVKEAAKTIDIDLQKYEGLTSITKLNSTQVFNGMPPVKLPVTLLFRAWRDSAKEVEKPLNQLMQWALPVSISKDSIIDRGAKLTSGNVVSALLPSKAPTLIAMTYKNRTYKPLVIESLGVPIGSPIDKRGNFVELSIQVQLATLTAIDRKDWEAASPMDYLFVSK